jgi:hypothetical protein
LIRPRNDLLSQSCGAAAAGGVIEIKVAAYVPPT